MPKPNDLSEKSIAVVTKDKKRRVIRPISIGWLHCYKRNRYEWMITGYVSGGKSEFIPLSDIVDVAYLSGDKDG